MLYQNNYSSVTLIYLPGVVKNIFSMLVHNYISHTLALLGLVFIHHRGVRTEDIAPQVH